MSFRKCSNSTHEYRPFDLLILKIATFVVILSAKRRVSCVLSGYPFTDNVLNDVFEKNSQGLKALVEGSLKVNYVESRRRES